MKDLAGIAATVEEDIAWVAVLISLRDTRMPLTTIQRFVSLWRDGITTLPERRSLAEAVGALTGVPARSLTRDEAEKTFGALVPFLTAENQISAAKAERELGWRKTVPTTLVADVTRGSYSSAI
ncbi:MAG: hypothetical protein H7145_15040 [Akkermansiaceae bacterium]|nr:hypothetical protein [Armatimonadota bacterium]